MGLVQTIVSVAITRRSPHHRHVRACLEPSKTEMTYERHHAAYHVCNISKTLDTSDFVVTKLSPIVDTGPVESAGGPWC